MSMHYGHTIDQELSDQLKKYTDSYDRANVSTITDIGTSTIRDVVYRRNSLTKGNSIAIKELIKIALKKCESQIHEAQNSYEYFKNLKLDPVA